MQFFPVKQRALHPLGRDTLVTCQRHAACILGARGASTQGEVHLLGFDGTYDSPMVRPFLSWGCPPLTYCARSACI